MKTSMKIFAMVIMLMTGIANPAEKASAHNVQVSFQVFYDQLSPYGDWVFDPHYGYVWIPDAGPGFMPYATGGYWMFTDYGWTWVSDYTWGWATFHYGRWYFDPSYGPVWIPGTEWAPAWVIWRETDGYYGWTPMGPNVTIDFAFGPGFYIPADRWVFVHGRDFCRHDVYRYYVDRSRNGSFIRHSYILKNTIRDDRRNERFFCGPGRNDVQRVSGRTINQVRIQDYDRPGTHVGKRELAIYRPVVEKSTALITREAPKKVVTYNEIRNKEANRPAERTGRQVDERTGGRVDERTSGRLDKRTSGQADVRTNLRVQEQSRHEQRDNFANGSERRNTEMQVCPAPQNNRHEQASRPAQERGHAEKNDGREGRK